MRIIMKIFTKASCYLIALIQLSVAQGADDIVTDSSGKVYRFDEKLALERAEDLVGRIKYELERRHLDPNKAKQQDLNAFSEQVLEVSQLGTCIAAIGEFSHGSGAIDALFSEIYKDVSNLPIPFTIVLASDYRRMLGQGVCRDADGKIMGGGDETSKPIWSLVHRAKLEIDARKKQNVPTGLP